MPDGLSGTLDTTALLLFFALPMSVVSGGALFVPWQRKWWNLGHWSHVLSRHGWVLAGLILMLVPEVIESQIDPKVTQLLGLEFTPWFAGLDGNLHNLLQAALPETWLHVLFTFVYVAGYPFLIIFTVMLGIWLDQGRFTRRALAAYAVCYAVALPFYLFFPVQEVWYATRADAMPVQNIATNFEWVKLHLYSFNEVNNCFPSLHTAISVAMAGVAWGGKVRAYAWVSAILAAMIVFSTIYLGIHWVADVVAGLLLAWFAVRLVNKIWPEGNEAPVAAA